MSSKGITRRKFLKIAGATGVAVGATGLPWKFGAKAALAQTWSPLLPKFAGPLRGLRIQGLVDTTELTPLALDPLNLPTVAAAAKWLRDSAGIPVLSFPLKNPDPVLDAKRLPYGIADLLAGTKEVMVGCSMYNIGCAQFQDFLHPTFETNNNPTTLWGYYDKDNPIKRHLAGVMVAVRGFSARMRFTNELTSNGTSTGANLQHIIPIDRNTIPGGDKGDNRLAVHHHGGWMAWLHDGGPFDAWRPNGDHDASFENGPSGPTDNPAMNPGQADYYYPNLTSSRLTWYHDHAFGITRLNAYAGIATGYLNLDPVQEAILNRTLERVATYTTLLDPVFKRYLGMPVDNVPLDQATRDAVVATVVNVKTANGIPLEGTIPSILSTIPIVLQGKKFVDGTIIDADDPSWRNNVPGLGGPVVPDVAFGTGSMWYDHIYDPLKWRLLKGPKYITPPNPSAVAEFSDDTTLVNGTVCPVADLEPKAYRFLFLNATQARGYNFNLRQVTPGTEILTDPATLQPVPTTSTINIAGTPYNGTDMGPGPSMWIIGSEAGYLLQAVECNNTNWVDTVNFKGNALFLGGERMDIVIDFSGCAGNEYVLYNDAMMPFPFGGPDTDYYAGNPANTFTINVPPGTTRDTRNCMKFRISQPVTVPEPQPTAAMIPAGLPRVWDSHLVSYAGYSPTGGPGGRPTPLPLPPAALIRNLTLNENFDEWGRLRQLVGTTTMKPGTSGFGRLYQDPPTETVSIANTPSAPGAPGASIPTIEVWNIFNTTGDTHPMHFHMVNGQILRRQPFKVVLGRFVPTGNARGPEPFECGWKETCQCHPGEVITIAFKWELPPVPFRVPSSRRLTGYWPPAYGPGQSTGPSTLGGNDPALKTYETVWHCHILEHEEHDMMRAIKITGVNNENPWW